MLLQRSCVRLCRVGLLPTRCLSSSRLPQSFPLRKKTEARSVSTSSSSSSSSSVMMGGPSVVPSSQHTSHHHPQTHKTQIPNNGITNRMSLSSLRFDTQTPLWADGAARRWFSRSSNEDDDEAVGSMKQEGTDEEAGAENGKGPDKAKAKAQSRTSVRKRNKPKEKNRRKETTSRAVSDARQSEVDIEEEEAVVMDIGDTEAARQRTALSDSDNEAGEEDDGDVTKVQDIIDETIKLNERTVAGQSEVYPAIPKDGSSAGPPSRARQTRRNKEPDSLVRHGRDVPVYPQVLALPVYRRPLFPGILYPIVITDKKTSQALLSLKKKGMPYVGVFLRKEAGDKAPLVSQDPYPHVGGRADHQSGGDGAVVNGGSAEHGQRIRASGSHGGEGPFIQGYGSTTATIDTIDNYMEKDAFNPIDNMDEIYHTGTFAQIWSINKIKDSNNNLVTQVVLLAHRRIYIDEFVQTDPVCLVKVTHVFDPDYSQQPPEENDAIKAYTMEMINTIKDILKRNSIFKEQLQYFLQNADMQKPSLLADYVAALTSADSKELQGILDTFDVKDRLSKALLLLKKELEVSKLQEDINKKVESRISENQKKFFLQEQLKSIKRELGMEKDDKDALAQKFLARLEGKTVPEEVQTVINEEIDKLSHLENHSSEFNITRNYLDWITILPWGIHTQENFCIDNAEAILNEEHYGMDDVKERILEFIAVGSLLGKVPQGKIICLVGPPGVGKTSIGKSIANALNREFFRFSVGGMTDVAEIKGHRRTYVGAMPGKLVQCLKKTQTANPVVLIDEVDKIGKGGYQGDPSSALLEVLDPEQNGSFTDHFLDVPVDLSKVLFICTANVADRIPGPLADRMEFIRLSGYVAQEKVEIVQRFLEPIAQKRTGISEKHAHLHIEAIESLIRWYCREAGVRNLQQHVDRIYRKIALQVSRKKARAANDSASGSDGEAAVPMPDVAGAVEAEVDPATTADVDEKIVVDSSNLHEYVGKPKFTTDRIYDLNPCGVVMGLAWNSMGGSTLYIESSVIDEDKNKAGLTVTGQLGDVMKESVSIAMTVAKGELRKHYPIDDTTSKEEQETTKKIRDFFSSHHLHVHVPEGSIPKDGPSAGITIVTSLLSLATQQHTRKNLAMTGEVTLTGKVLPIGGVKEKTIAAQRSGVTDIIFPADNQRDWDELQDFITEGLTPHFVHYYSEVYDIAFSDHSASSTGTGTGSSSDQ